MDSTIREGNGPAEAADVTVREGNGPAEAADVTVREGAGLAGATDATLREGSSTGTGQMNLVPGGLFLRYTLLAPLEVTSGEADLWFIRHNQTEYVLKLYRYGIEPKAAMTQKLQALATQHVVKVEEHGKFGNRAFEILEKMVHGDLRQLAKPLAEAQLKEVLRELSEAVSHLHAEGIIHRDLKPANVLIRSREPLDLVLTDFGIASLSGGEDLHLTNANRTASYSAPEALTGVVSAASDWWSVGVMLLEYLKGVHPFAGKSEQVVNFHLVSKGLPVPADLSAEWSELLKGLLTRDHEQRWQGTQVSNWLAGQRNQALHYEGDRQQTHTHKPYQFGGKDSYSAKELAVALGENWGDGVKNFGRGFVSSWVERELGDQPLASRLLDIHDDQSLNEDEKLSSALIELAPDLPGVWRGSILNHEWAVREQEEFHRLLASSIRERFERQPGWPAEDAAKADARKTELQESLRKEEDLRPEHLAALERIIQKADPRLLFSGTELTAATLVNQWKVAVPVLQSKVPTLYARLTGQQWLQEAAARWCKYWPRVAALQGGTTEEQALPWILAAPEALQAAAQERLAKYVGAKDEWLNRLWSSGGWSTAECVTLCAANETGLLTQYAKHEADSLTYLQAIGVEMDWELAKELIKANSWEAIEQPWKEALASPALAELKTNLRLKQTLESQQPEFLDAVAACAAVGPALKRLEARQTIAKAARKRFLSFAGASATVVALLAGFFWALTKKSKVTESPPPARYGVNPTTPAPAFTSKPPATSPPTDLWTHPAWLKAEVIKANAEAGDPLSQYQLSRRYKSGYYDLPRDDVEAKKWLDRAGKKAFEAASAKADKGDLLAQHLLGDMLFNGHIVATNHTESVKWFRAAAEAGFPPAMNNLGNAYANGDGVVKDTTESVKWYRAAAAAGIPPAMFNLGSAYANGDGGVVKDMAEAVKWWQISSAQGFGLATHYLGYLHSIPDVNRSSVFKQNISETIRLYSKSAEQGHEFAKLDLGLIYLKGEIFINGERDSLQGVGEKLKNSTEAKKWLAIAAKSGDSKVADKAAALVNSINRAATAAAVATQKRVEWMGASMRRSGFPESKVTKTLTQGGKVLAWGNNSSRQCDIPAALSGVVSIAAGANVTLALRAEGIIDTFRGIINNTNYWPEDPAGIVAISANGYHCFAIKSDGTIIHGKPEFVAIMDAKMLPPTGLINVRSVVVGRGSCAAFKDDGTGIFWGQITGDFNVNIPTSASRVVGLAVGDSFVLWWGDNGVLEKKGLGMNRELTFPSGLGKVRDVVLGQMHAVALLQDGTVVAWGRNDKGQSTVPAGLSGAVAIAAGQNHTVVLKSDGTVVAWGDNSKGQCAVPADLGGVVAIATGDEHTVALRLD